MKYDRLEILKYDRPNHGSSGHVYNDPVLPMLPVHRDLQKNFELQYCAKFRRRDIRLCSCLCVNSKEIF